MTKKSCLVYLPNKTETNKVSRKSAEFSKKKLFRIHFTKNKIVCTLKQLFESKKKRQAFSLATTLVSEKQKKNKRKEVFFLKTALCFFLATGKRCWWQASSLLTCKKKLSEIVSFLEKNLFFLFIIVFETQSTSFVFFQLLPI